MPLLNGIDHVSFAAAKIWCRQKSFQPQSRLRRSALRLDNSSIAHHFVVECFSGGKKLARVRHLKHLRTAGIRAAASWTTKPTLMWGKIVFLAPIRSDDHGCGINRSAASWRPASWRQLGACVIREACAVATAEGANVDAEMVIAGRDEDAAAHAQLDAERRRTRQSARTRRDCRTDLAWRRAPWDSGPRHTGTGRCRRKQKSQYRSRIKIQRWRISSVTPRAPLRYPQSLQRVVN